MGTNNIRNSFEDGYCFFADIPVVKRKKINWFALRVREENNDLLFLEPRGLKIKASYLSSYSLFYKNIPMKVPSTTSGRKSP